MALMESTLTKIVKKAHHWWVEEHQDEMDTDVDSAYQSTRALSFVLTLVRTINFFTYLAQLPVYVCLVPVREISDPIDMLMSEDFLFPGLHSTALHWQSWLPLTVVLCVVALLGNCVSFCQKDKIHMDCRSF